MESNTDWNRKQRCKQHCYSKSLILKTSKKYNGFIKQQLQLSIHTFELIYVSFIAYYYYYIYTNIFFSFTCSLSLSLWFFDDDIYTIHLQIYIHYNIYACFSHRFPMLLLCYCYCHSQSVGGFSLHFPHVYLC